MISFSKININLINIIRSYLLPDIMDMKSRNTKFFVELLNSTENIFHTIDLCSITELKNTKIINSCKLCYWIIMDINFQEYHHPFHQTDSKQVEQI